MKRLLPILLLLAGPATAADDGPVDPMVMDLQIQALKEEVLGLNRDLTLLREDLLFPADSQVSVYVSLDVGELFKLDSVKLKVGDRVVATHLYSERELSALRRGGVHQLWLGNLPSGEHDVIAFFTGVGPNGRDYRRAADLKLRKGFGPQTLELKIADLERRLQPEFVVREWR